MIQDRIKQFVSSSLASSHKIVPMDGDASLRSYSRVFDHKKSYILMNSSLDPKSMVSFLKVADVLSPDYSPPQILAVDHDNHLVLLEDLGDTSYTSLLNRDDTKEYDLYKNAVALLVNLHAQTIGVKFDFYSKDLLLDEAMLLIDWYYPLIKGKEISKKLRRQYIDNWLSIFSKISLQQKCLVLRDYHADNLMWLQERGGVKKVGLLDFQDAVMGSVAYDLVSLLEDARRDVSKEVADHMVNLYIKEAKVDRESFILDYNILGAQRNSKILGIFARKFLYDKDIRYLEFMPRVLEYLCKDLKHPVLSFMMEWFVKTELLDKQNLKQVLGSL